ncbi:alpha/beta hydrolase [Streptomyces sp. NPDC096030]|uniref:alpha/beta hydrolase n=1 Tax=Streptomyces sp. NPDC096030 TaxID=3155423 RepID=UPI003321F369
MAWRTGRRLAAAAIAAALSTPAPAAATGSPAAGASPLVWSPCSYAGQFDCAKLKVPLDHQQPGGRLITLAVIRKPAARPEQRLGTLFFNPGGPGTPGTGLPALYESFPREVRERFDIVSWDPRGVGRSTAVQCFATQEESDAWFARIPAGFPVGPQEQKTWNDAFSDLGRRCQQRDAELLRYVSTADTARDLDRLRQAAGDRQLTYFGASYGTFLGATYANLFPGKVRAMVLDANLDPRAYMNSGSGSGPELPTFLRLGSDLGAAAVLDRFLALCGSVSAGRCAFSAGTPQATRDKFHQLMQRLRDRPIGPWTYARTVAATVGGLYRVQPGWTDLAGTLQNLWQRRTPDQPVPQTPPDAPYRGNEQTLAVLCESPNPRSLRAYPALEGLAVERSGDAGLYGVWAETQPCATWPARPAAPYTGPWNKPTASPILIVSTTHDPATPYQGAQAMARELASARLLTLNGYGHSALANPSTCVQDHESRYLIHGTLPAPGSTCEQNTPPFSPLKPQGAVAAGGGYLSST